MSDSHNEPTPSARRYSIDNSDDDHPSSHEPIKPVKPSNAGATELQTYASQLRKYVEELNLIDALSSEAAAAQAEAAAAQAEADTATQAEADTDAKTKDAKHTTTQTQTNENG